MQVSMAGVVPSERGGSLHQCFPLYRFYWASNFCSRPNLACFSLLLALDNPKVNYFSLDIEGAEIQVLRSVPWHLVDIEVRLVLSFLWGLNQVDLMMNKGHFCWDSTSWASFSGLEKRGATSIPESFPIQSNFIKHKQTLHIEKRWVYKTSIRFFPRQLHQYLEEQGYQYVGTLGGKASTIFNS